MAERAAKTIDERFDEVSHAFREQRDFAIFCADKLRGELCQDIRDSEGRLTRRLVSLEGRFEGLEGRFEGLEGRFEGLEGRFEGLEGRFEGLEGRFEGLEGRFEGLEGKVDGLEKTMARGFTRHELLLTEILNEVKKR